MSLPPNPGAHQSPPPGAMRCGELLQLADVLRDLLELADEREERQDVHVVRFD